jgi:hypothetical protein
LIDILFADIVDTLLQPFDTILRKAASVRLPTKKMRLLNLNTLELREFIDSARPPYVILSHTWEAEEMSLQEFYRPNIQNIAGYSKILNFYCQRKENRFE